IYGRILGVPVYVVRDATDLRETLASLRDKSLLRLTAEGRYDMHTFIRQFAHEKHGEDEELLLRHAAWAFQWLAAETPALQLAHNAALTRTATELQNLRLAWDTALHHARADLLAPALPGLEGFYTARSGYAEMTEAFQNAAVAFPAETHPALHARLRVGQGVGLYRQGRAQDAYAVLEQAYHLSLQLDPTVPPALRATCALHVGIAHLFLSRYEDARTYLEEARTLARQIGDTLLEAHVLRNFAIIHTEKGQLEEAYRLTETSLGLYQAAGNELGAAIATVNLSTTAHYLGRHAQLQQFAEEALARGKALENRSVTSLALSNLGLAAFARKEYVEALRFYEEAKKIYEDIGNPVDIARTEITIANALQELARLPEAIALHKHALKTLQEAGQRWLAVLTLNNLGSAYLHAGDDEQARRYLAQGLQEAQEIEAETLAHAALLGFADLAVRQGQVETGARLAAFVRHVSGDDFENQEGADKLLARTKEKFSAEGFARSMEAGQQLTLKETVKFVSEQL
ncbi:MAG: tetratricopeptide repeat protein, partial [Anaerolineales bacterium]|nr:tetratricopeptide repeat protein [Anaerolineales bacterium]